MWEKCSVVFKLKSPLHIGYTPFKGSVVSPTRYYVLGRNFWGAITKRITEFLYNEPKDIDYRNIGKEVMKNFKFSHFYLYDGKTVFTPSYTDEGLNYGGIPQTKFEHMFIGSRISTAIDENSGTARDESLHEIEFINNKFRDEKGNIKGVKIAGYIWVKNTAKILENKIQFGTNSITINGFNIIQELVLGGESKYGFGDVEIDFLKQGDEDEKDEKVMIEINNEQPLDCYLEYSKEIQFEVDIELLTGRVYYDPETDNNEPNNTPGEKMSKVKICFTPGTIIGKYDAELNYDGTLRIINNPK
ncbi:MAG: hypothetical protein GX428_03260 [Candidatus Atribacteria bacterium]|nr:hypothetical protein [Candidatus Atribacteria bacterium]